MILVSQFELMLIILVVFYSFISCISNPCLSVTL